MKKHRRISWLFVLCLLLSALPAQAQEAPVAPTGPAATYVVNSAGDEKDAYVDDLICDTQRNPVPLPPVPPSGLCTLRAAIETANRTGGPSAITFSGPLVIQYLTSMRGIDYPVTIDGGNQVVLDGSQLQNPGFGLSLNRLFSANASGSVVKGLTIRNFNWGISLNDVSGVTIQGNDIRLNATGRVLRNAAKRRGAAQSWTVRDHVP